MSNVFCRDRRLGGLLVVMLLVSAGCVSGPGPAPSMAAAPAASAPPPLPDDAPWWQATIFDPGAAPQAGLEWREARWLTDAALAAQLTEEQLADIAAAGLTTQAVADLDADGAPETYRVGVYGTAQNDQGHYVAVLEGGVPIKVFPRDGRAQFSGLVGVSDAIYWHHCIGCDDIDVISARDGVITIRRSGR